MPSLLKSMSRCDDAQLEGRCSEGNEVMQSTFLGEVNENEIRSIVAKLKNKTSTKSGGLDVIIVKNTADCILNI